MHNHPTGITNIKHTRLSNEFRAHAFRLFKLGLSLGMHTFETYCKE
jgi:hypothetical protein